MFTKTKIQEIHFTKDYGMFKIIKENRDKDNPNYKQLKESIQTKHIKSAAIIVNEKLEILDGQHRFWIFKELGLVVPYTIEVGGTEQDVRLLNTAGKKWSLYDHLTAYANAGLKEYKKTSKFLNHYGFKINETVAMLRSRTRVNGVVMTQFKQGFFKIADLDHAEKTAETILSFESVYKGVRRRSFVFAMLNCLQTKGFDPERLKRKIELQPNKLKAYLSWEECLVDIQKVYNFNEPQSKKLRLVNDL